MQASMQVCVTASKRIGDDEMVRWKMGSAIAKKTQIHLDCMNQTQ